MNRKAVLLVSILAVIVLTSLQSVSAYTYYNGYSPSYTESYNKQVTYTPYGKTTEISSNTPEKSTYYYSSYDYAPSYYNGYSNRVYSYFQTGPNYPRQIYYTAPYYADSSYRSSYYAPKYYQPYYTGSYYDHSYRPQATVYRYGF